MCAALPLKIYSTSAAVTNHLRRPEFVFVDTPAEADILWIMGETEPELMQYINGPQPKYLNHFVNEVSKKHFVFVVDDFGENGGARVAVNLLCFLVFRLIGILHAHSSQCRCASDKFV